MVAIEALATRYSRKEFFTSAFTHRKKPRFRVGRPEKHHLSSKPTPPKKEGLSRREFLKMGVAISLFGAAVRIFEPWNWFSSQPEPEITTYYPELKEYPILAKGEFTVGHIPTKWFNFSGMTFDPVEAAATFDFWERLGSSQRRLSYQFGGQIIPFFLSEEPKKDRILFFIPQNAPPPNWSGRNNTASTTGLFDNGPLLTFIRIPDSGKDITPDKVFTTAESVANQRFLVEVCQSTVYVRSLSIPLANLGQEIICNSYAIAFSLRQRHVPFTNYQALAKEITISKDPQSLPFTLYMLSEQEYSQIPTINQSLTAR